MIRFAHQLTRTALAVAFATAAVAGHARMPPATQTNRSRSSCRSPRGRIGLHGPSAGQTAE